MNADGSQRRALIKDVGGGDDAAPSWSPDGRRIAFGAWHSVGSYGGGGWGISVMNADGSGVRRLTNRYPETDHYYETDPDWSPDGRKIAFTTEFDCACESEAGPYGSGDQVAVVNADGSGHHYLTSNGQSLEPS